ncbi:hypothetical protein AX774_g3726 [Zancudomyces culisetae]|uniref:Uncharacterized protein n=1 Tax=Zancudomyces culisetae TaxID=1213189 RepID=A0A1R1PP73_ZANCU|nr:hypothetical protein AX774_g3726 [Zancudomyces culisetae]|eukprot:OMH82785.1 hypothetical protein AX774_g3726 [Zancudomyces culisetae]
MEIDFAEGMGRTTCGERVGEQRYSEPVNLTTPNIDFIADRQTEEGIDIKQLWRERLKESYNTIMGALGNVISSGVLEEYGTEMVEELKREINHNRRKKAKEERERKIDRETSGKNLGYRNKKTKAQQLKRKRSTEMHELDIPMEFQNQQHKSEEEKREGKEVSMGGGLVQWKMDVGTEIEADWKKVYKRERLQKGVKGGIETITKELKKSSLVEEGSVRRQVQERDRGGMKGKERIEGNPKICDLPYLLLVQYEMIGSPKHQLIGAINEAVSQWEQRMVYDSGGDQESVRICLEAQVVRFEQAMNQILASSTIGPATHRVDEEQALRELLEAAKWLYEHRVWFLGLLLRDAVGRALHLRRVVWQKYIEMDLKSFGCLDELSGIPTASPLKHWTKQTFYTNIEHVYKLVHDKTELYFNTKNGVFTGRPADQSRLSSVIRAVIDKFHDVCLVILEMVTKVYNTCMHSANGLKRLDFTLVELNILLVDVVSLVSESIQFTYKLSRFLREPSPKSTLLLTLTFDLANNYVSWVSSLYSDLNPHPSLARPKKLKYSDVIKFLQAFEKFESLVLNLNALILNSPFPISSSSSSFSSSFSPNSNSNSNPDSNPNPNPNPLPFLLFSFSASLLNSSLLLLSTISLLYSNKNPSISAPLFPNLTTDPFPSSSPFASSAVSSSSSLHPHLFGSLYCTNSFNSSSPDLYSSYFDNLPCMFIDVVVNFVRVYYFLINDD